MSTISSLFAATIDRRRLALLKQSIRLIRGPTSSELKADEAIVLCVVRDGEDLVKAFIEHYLGLGFSHIYFLDNSSTDRTAEIISGYDRTTLLRSTKPFSDYYVVFKNYLIQRFGQRRWCVLADIDEFLYFPLGKTLGEVLSYLESNRYDTVCVQMLDMFAASPLKMTEQKQTWALDALKTNFCYYDLSDVERTQYGQLFQRRVNSGLKFLWGGIRKTVFGRDCFLTKEALFYGRKRTYLKSSHLLRKATVADFSAVFLHYKFVDDFYSTTVKAVAEENHWKNSEEYKAYLAVLEQQPQLTLKRESSFQLKQIDELIDRSFLFVSDEFLASSQPFDDK